MFIRQQVDLILEDVTSAFISITLLYVLIITICVWYNQTGHSKRWFFFFKELNVE